MLVSAVSPPSSSIEIPVSSRHVWIFGNGYAAQHPELVSAFIQAASPMQIAPTLLEQTGVRDTKTGVENGYRKTGAVAVICFERLQLQIPTKPPRQTDLPTVLWHPAGRR